MKTLATLLMLVPVLAWAGPAEDAKYAAEQVLVAENVLNVYFTANDQGRLTLLFGRQIANWQIDVMLAKLAKIPAINGITHAQVDTDYCPIR